MDKTDNNNNAAGAKKSELAALFDDLQDTLNSSILNEKKNLNEKKTAGKNRPESKLKSERPAAGALSYEKTAKPEKLEKQAPAGVDVKEREEPPVTLYADNRFAAGFDGVKPDPEVKSGVKSGAKSGAKSEMKKETKKIPPHDAREKQENIDYQLLETLGGVGVGLEYGEGEPGYSGKYEIERKGVKKTGASPGLKTVKTAGKKLPDAGGLFRASAKEYVSPEQNREIFKAYHNMYVWEAGKLIICGLLFLALAYIEIAPFLNLPLHEFLIFYGYLYILINLQLFLWAGGAAYKSLIFGVKSMFKGEVNLYSAAAILFIFAVIHTIASYFLISGGVRVVLFNSVAALALLCLTLYNLLDINFEMAGFKAASSKKIKYTVRLDNNSPEEREMFRDIIPQDMTVGQITKIGFASNFFSRTARYKNHGEPVRLYIYASLTAAVLTAVAGIIIRPENELYHTLTTAAFLFLGTVPLCAFISTAYPTFRAQKKSQAYGAAFVGVDSIEEYSEIAIISLADRDIFPPSAVRLANARVYGNNRIDTVLHYLCALFCELNMPAAEVFKGTIGWDEQKASAADIKIIDIADSGICYVAGGEKLFAGKAEYIENLGLSVLGEPDLDEQFLRSAGSIMVLASENEIIAKIYLKYELTANFHDILKNLRKMNSCVCVRTFDPNIDELLLHKLANMKKFPIKVMKLKNIRDKYKIAEKAETGIVSRDSLNSILSALLIASQTKTTIRSNALIKVIAFAVSLAVTAAIALFGPPWLNHAGMLLLLQLFWAGTVVFLSAISP